MGRREMRAELQASWSTYTPRVPGTPFRKKDLADADELSALGEPSHPGAPAPATQMAAQQPDGAFKSSSGMQPSEMLMRGMLARFSR